MKSLRLLLACQSVAGHLNPNLALARALAKRGHCVAFYSGILAREAVEAEGFCFFPYNPSMDSLLSRILLPANGSSAASRIATKRWLFLRSRELNATMKEWLLETVPQQVDDLKRICEQFQPDVLVSDPTLLGPPLVLKHCLPIPVAIYSILAGCSIPGKDDPPWGTGLAPPRTAWGRFRNRIQKRVSDWMLRDFRSEANRIRAQYGLPTLVGRPYEETGRVPLYMVCSCPSLDYNRKDLPKCVAYVGACIWDGGKTAQIPGWLENLNRNLPVVHVTEGTISTGEPMLLRTAVAALSGLPMHVILTTGRHRKPEEINLGKKGSNIRVEQFVPHKYLFEKTDLVVTTGGAGTVITSLVAGVPLIIVPTAWELAENAQRVAESGAGLRIDPRSCTPESLRQAVETVLANPRFRENARRIGKDLQDQGGPDRACQLIERLAVSPN